MLVTVATATAAAEDSEQPIVSETHEGAAGAWVPDAALRDFLADSIELGSQKKIVVVQQAVIANLRIQASELELAVEQRKTAEASLETALTASEKARQSAEESRDSWFRNPVLMTAAGVVCGVLVTTIIVIRK